jgi:hypothetical protein
MLLRTAKQIHGTSALKKEAIGPADVSQNRQDSKPQYPKPKILAVDLAEDVCEALKGKGFNVSVGSFGKPYKVEKHSGFVPLIGTGKLPNYTEQEILIVDLAFAELEAGPQETKHRPNDEIDLWGKCDRGFIDPRPRNAYRAKEAFDRVLAGGGAFIVFVDEKTDIELILARSNTHRKELYDQNDFPHDVWHFIWELADMEAKRDHGTEMKPCMTETALGRLVSQHLSGGEFTCTLSGGHRRENEWKTLAENKFGDPVSLCRLRSKEGSVIVLPQLTDKVGFITKLLTTVLPDLAPHLFPYFEAGKWTHRPEYELPHVVQLLTKQQEIEQRAQRELVALNENIKHERDANGWMHNLLTGTDAVLVEAVKKALGTLSFGKVVDVDVERDREGKSRREDLQIHDQSPTLVVDVKGVGGYPSDDEALQADKHAAIRMREWKRVDVCGLTIINHQRHLPPLERENTMPFRQELLDAAQERSLGLMTTWDLYRCLRNTTKNAWPLESVKSIFYGKGRIEVLPQHYQFIGRIAKAWTDKFGVVIESGELNVGDKIAVEFDIEFEEIAVTSIRINDREAQKAIANDPAGLLWPTDRPKLREGLRVFRILLP